MVRQSFLIASVSAAIVLVFIACSDSSSAPSGDGSDGGAYQGTDARYYEPKRDDAGGEEEEEEKDSGQKQDSGPCGALEAPNLNGPRACGAVDFGKAAVPYSGYDASAVSYTGGAIPPGTYDAVVAEYRAGAAGSWHETIVVGANGRFTRTRQIDTGNLGPMTYRSGTLSLDGGSITFAGDCYVNADAGRTPDTATEQYRIVKGPCGETQIQYAAGAFRFTLTPRLAK